MMRVARSVLKIEFLGFCLFFGGGNLLCYGQQPSFQVDVKTVEIPVTVLDPNGRYVTGLHPDDFSLYEEDRLQRIGGFTKDNRNVQVLLLLDLSRSVQSYSKSIKKAARQFVNYFSREDSLAVIGFAQGLMPIQDWTTDKKRIAKAIGKLETGTQTQLYDAVQSAMDKSMERLSGRKACLLITDGIDTSSESTLRSLQKSIYRRETAIYAINILRAVKGGMERYRRVGYVARIMERLGEENYLQKFFQKKEEEMDTLALSSGGRAFFTDNMEKMYDICREIAMEMQGQYVLTFNPDQGRKEPGYHTIRLKYRDPRCRVLYRQGYYDPGVGKRP